MTSWRLSDLRRDPDPRPAPAAPSRRAASRCGDGAGRSAAPGAGGRFVGGGRHRRRQPPSAPRARRSARPPRSAPLPSAPLPSPLPPPPPLPSAPAPAVPWRCCRSCAAASPPPPPQEATHGARSDGDRLRGDEAYGKKDQRPRGMLFLTPRGKRRCSPGQRQEPSYLRPCILSKTKLPFLVGMDWPGFGSLAPRKTKVTSSSRGRLSGKRCQKELEFLENKSWRCAPDNPRPGW
ncbi:uncharacterized protein LOC135424832 [Pseudopipra pipra]|uniref:uncharacterized protein LOC135424832 n=1 Tax=Pseudopipra pipra TaxID=415032 RepID=UPI003138B3DC